MKWFIKALKNYANFKSRAKIQEYWIFWLYFYISFIILLTIELLSGTYNFITGIGPLTGLYLLIMFIPSISATVRRLHDVDKSGWFLLIGIIPVVGQIWLLIKLLTDSYHKTNKYGDFPNGTEYGSEKVELLIKRIVIMIILGHIGMVFTWEMMVPNIPLFALFENIDTQNIDMGKVIFKMFEMFILGLALGWWFTIPINKFLKS